MESWSRQCTRQRSARRSAWPAAAERLCSTACRRATFPAPIFEIVLKGLTVRGSIVGTRQDLQEALEFYAEGKIHPTVSTRELSEVNAVLDEMKHAKIDGRVVIKY